MAEYDTVGALLEAVYIDESHADCIDYKGFKVSFKW